MLDEVRNLKTSIIVFETAKKINKTLEDLIKTLGNREISICREMTKKFEEIISGRLEDVFSTLKSRNLKGEIVLVVGAQENRRSNINIDEIITSHKGKHSPSELAKIISNKTGLPKSDIYNKIIKKKEI